MNKRARQIIDRSAKNVGLVWTGDALPYAVIKNVTADIDNELGKLKWLGENEDWNNAIEAVRKELRTIYED